MCVIGLSYMIIYLNYLSLGFTIFEYFNYILSKIECLIFIPGYLIVITTILKEEKWITYTI